MLSQLLRLYQFQGATPVERGAFRAAFWANLHTLAQLLVAHAFWWSGQGLNPWGVAFQLVLYNPPLANCFLSVLLLFFFLKPDRLSLVGVFAIGAILELLAYQLRLLLGVPGPHWNFIGLGLGVAAFGWLLFHWFFASHRLASGYLLLGIFVPFVSLFGSFSLSLLTLATPQTRDLWGYLLDCTLGSPDWQPVYAIADWLRRHVWAENLANWVYAMLGTLMMVAILGELRFPRRCHFNVTLAIILGGALVPFLYLLFPMTGYPFWTKTFPAGPLPPQPSAPFWIEVNPAQVRNAMPSMHLTWMLLCHLTMSRCSWAGCLVGWLMTLGTVAGTLVVGHYAVDLVMAAPFTLCLIALSSRAEARLRRLALAMGIGLLTVGYWAMLTQLPNLMAQPWLTKVGSLVLVISSMGMEAKLASNYRKANPETRGGPSDSKSE